MDLDIDVHHLEKGLYQLFKYAFTTNCCLDDESTTQEELQTLEELENSEVLENLKDLVLGLLKYKKECKTSEISELIQRSEQLEKLLQKLEAEVRGHIRVQHQLKLHIELNQQRINDLEKVELENNKIIKDLEEKGSGKTRNSEMELFKKEFEEKSNVWLEIIEKKERSLKNIQKENSKLKGLLETKAKEHEQMKKEVAKIKKKASKDFCRSISTESIPKKLDFTKLKSKFKEQTTLYHRANPKTDRKSEDVEIKMNSSPYLKRNYYTDAMRKEASTTTLRKNNNIHGHIRSVSDFNVLFLKKCLV